MKLTSKQTVAKAELWCMDHKRAYKYLQRQTRAHRHDSRDISIGYLTEMMRRELKVHLPNAYRPVIARKLEHDVAGARFTKAKSKVDAIMENRED